MTTAAASAPRALPRIAVRRPELAALLALATVLNLWALSINGWANEYYSAAVRSMSTSWHAFLYGSFDAAGVMTVDKPPLALWVQALSARVFGFHPLSVLVPQALMGVATVALTYDFVRRRFGRTAGLVGGLVLALTPITVAISRHNNPDALLIAPAAWSAQTLGHATNGTFPAGGAQAAGTGSGPFGGDGTSLTAALDYARAHGGGTVAVSSQNGTGMQVIDGANVAAIGGFSGNESQITTQWLAQAVEDGRIRYVLTSGGGFSDGRTGSRDVMSAVEQTCAPVSGVDGLYDCLGVPLS